MVTTPLMLYKRFGYKQRRKSNGGVLNEILKSQFRWVLSWVKKSNDDYNATLRLVIDHGMLCQDRLSNILSLGRHGKKIGINRNQLQSLVKSTDKIPGLPFCPILG